MPRIRTTKPEFYESDTLAMVSLSAERTFSGLWPFSDDYGRVRDNPAFIRSKVWCVRTEHPEEGVADDLRQLAAVGVICRYVGCDGKNYLHTVNWDEHQKIDKPGAPHWPSCPVHQATQRCSKCGGPCKRLSRDTEASKTASRDLPEPSPSILATAATPCVGSPRDVEPVTAAPATPTAVSRSEPRSPVAVGSESAGRDTFAESSGTTHRVLAEGSAPGPGTLDLGPVPSGGRKAPAPAATERLDDRSSTPTDAPTASRLIAEHVSACRTRPPKDVVGQTAKLVARLLDEGIAPEAVRAGLERLRAKALHPSVLPSLVNEALNPPTPGAGTGGTGYRPWTNSPPVTDLVAVGTGSWGSL
ncbi:hypothetical protein [Embleya sp. NPDC020630]|uniref:hypothetical protein n=1 Tax=Embleya sp. NPDC020630 TaxID=3363979 RepID=UPI0037B09EE5